MSQVPASDHPDRRGRRRARVRQRHVPARPVSRQRRDSDRGRLLPRRADRHPQHRDQPRRDHLHAVLQFVRAALVFDARSIARFGSRAASPPAISRRRRRCRCRRGRWSSCRASFIDMLGKLREAQDKLGAQIAEERRMREELQSLQRQVIRQERLAAIGVLVSGVAHELNNPLQAILGFADLLQMRKDLPPRRRRRARAHPEGEHARQRHHPQPVALHAGSRPPTRRRCGCATSSRRSSSCGSASSTRTRSTSIVDEPADPVGAGGVRRAAAGGAEFPDQCRAGGDGDARAARRSR